MLPKCLPVSVVEVHPVVASGINKLVAGCSLGMKDWIKDSKNYFFRGVLMSFALFMLDREDVFLHLQQRGVEVEPVASNVNGHGELK